MKYVPFNGGVGGRQLRWLRKEVVAARERGDRILVRNGSINPLPAHSSESHQRAPRTHTTLSRYLARPNSWWWGRAKEKAPLSPLARLPSTWLPRC